MFLNSKIHVLTTVSSCDVNEVLVGLRSNIVGSVVDATRRPSAFSLSSSLFAVKINRETIDRQQRRSLWTRDVTRHHIVLVRNAAVKSQNAVSLLHLLDFCHFGEKF